MLTNKVRLPVELHPETYQNLPGCANLFRTIIECYRLFHNEMLKEQAICVNAIKDTRVVGHNSAVVPGIKD